MALKIAPLSPLTEIQTGRDSASRPPHELGHWIRDRGNILFACSSAAMNAQWMQTNPETLANRFASDLLLPVYLFLPRGEGQPMTFETVRRLSTEFETSLTSTAIRLVEYGSFPAMLICNSKTGREWFLKSKDIPASIWPVEEPGSGTAVYRFLRGDTSSCPSLDISADEWFMHPRSHEYLVHEESVQITEEYVLSLLWWKDENQLIDLGEDEERREARRSDKREED